MFVLGTQQREFHNIGKMSHTLSLSGEETSPQNEDDVNADSFIDLGTLSYSDNSYACESLVGQNAHGRRHNDEPPITDFVPDYDIPYWPSREQQAPCVREKMDYKEYHSLYTAGQEDEFDQLLSFAPLVQDSCYTPAEPTISDRSLDKELANLSSLLVNISAGSDPQEWQPEDESVSPHGQRGNCTTVVTPFEDLVDLCICNSEHHVENGQGVKRNPLMSGSQCGNRARPPVPPDSDLDERLADVPFADLVDVCMCNGDRNTAEDKGGNRECGDIRNDDVRSGDLNPSNAGSQRSALESETQSSIPVIRRQVPEESASVWNHLPEPSAQNSTLCSEVDFGWDAIYNNLRAASMDSMMQEDMIKSLKSVTEEYS